MKYLSLFSGIGAFESAMKNLNIPFELVGFSEIDKYAIKSYCAIHSVPESLNLGDITKVDETKLGQVDFITYGFPCQDISLAGKQQGLFNEDGSKTRSGLFFDALRIIEHTQPMVAIAENVKNLTSKKFAAQFEIVLNSLEEVGYNNYWMVLNSKDFGIPQNRERVFIVSIRKDCDTGIFEFPKPYPLKLRLKDMLEDMVDDKFYLSNKMVDYILDVHNVQEGTKWEGRADSDVLNPDIAHTLSVRAAGGSQRAGVSNFVIDNFDGEIQVKELKERFDSEPKIKVIGNYSPSNHDASRIVDVNGLAPTVKENHGTVTAIVEPQWISEKGVKYILDPKRGMCTDINPDVIQPLTATGQSNWTGSFVSPDIESLEKSSTIGGKEPVNIKLKNGKTITSNDDVSTLRIRKLTPKECFRLMGFKDEDFEKAEKVNSNTQLYKQAGNSIVVDVAEELLCMLFDEEGNFFI